MSTSELVSAGLFSKACPQAPYPRGFCTLPGCDRLPQAHKAGAMPWPIPRHSDPAERAGSEPGVSERGDWLGTGGSRRGISVTSVGHGGDISVTSSGTQQGRPGTAPGAASRQRPPQASGSAAATFPSRAGAPGKRDCEGILWDRASAVRSEPANRSRSSVASRSRAGIAPLYSSAMSSSGLSLRKRP